MDEIFIIDREVSPSVTFVATRRKESRQRASLMIQKISSISLDYKFYCYQRIINFTVTSKGVALKMTCYASHTMYVQRVRAFLSSTMTARTLSNCLLPNIFTRARDKATANSKEDAQRSRDYFNCSTSSERENWSSQATRPDNEARRLRLPSSVFAKS